MLCLRHIRVKFRSKSGQQHLSGTQIKRKVLSTGDLTLMQLMVTRNDSVANPLSANKSDLPQTCWTDSKNPSNLRPNVVLRKSKAAQEGRWQEFVAFLIPEGIIFTTKTSPNSLLFILLKWMFSSSDKAKKRRKKRTAHSCHSFSLRC